MVWYEDLAPCPNWQWGQERVDLRAIGWLERGKPFPTDQVPREVTAKLTDLLKDPWQPATALGWHCCDLCPSAASAATGYQNLFIPADGFIYVCPALIVHYIEAHGYQPPASFCQSVLECPPMSSRPYFKAIFASGGRGLIWEAPADQSNDELIQTLLDWK